MSTHWVQSLFGDKPLANWGTLLMALSIPLVFGLLALPTFIADVFPYWLLTKQKNAQLAPVTKSFAGKTILITGANGAFGSRVARMIAELGVARLVLADVRDCGGVKADIEERLTKEGKKKPEILVWQVDMMDYESCKQFAEKAKGLKTLDGVLLAAGILSFKRKESPAGWETTIQVNFLSTALLSLLLLPALKSSPGVLEPPTLNFVTTFSIYPASPFMLSTPSARTPVTDAPYISALSKNSELMQPNQYGRSKGLLLYFTRELAARARASPKFGHVTINSADPGAAWTGLTEMNRTKALPNLIMSWSARDVESGAKTLTNGVCAGPESHGGVLVDYDLEPYPGFMERESGVRRQKRVWEETRWALERDLPSLRGVFEGLPNPAR